MTETTVVKLRGDEISVSAKQAARLIGLPFAPCKWKPKRVEFPQRVDSADGTFI